MKLVYAIAVLSLSGCMLHAQNAASKSSSASKSGIDLSAIDKNVDPCNDFYQYACGNWLANNPIPSDQSTWGRFNELMERNQKILRQIAEDAAKNQKRSPLDQKVGAFYESCMDEEGIEKRGTQPLKEELARIAAIQSKEDLVKEVARLHDHQVSVLFRFGASADPNDAKMSIADLDQGGLGLPERGYYTRTDEKAEEMKKKYAAHVTKMFELMGNSTADASAKASKVMAIETALAKASLDNVARRNPKLLVNKYKTDNVAELGNNFDLKKYFLERQSPSFSELNVSVPAFFKALNQELSSIPLSDWKEYLSWHYLRSSAPLLPKTFVAENFDFYGRTLTGAKELRPRWKRCVDMTDAQLGEVLGRKFVEQTFGQQGKQRTLEMVGEIERAMASDIDALPWMSAATKEQAHVKLKGVTNKIGYPEKWRDYSSVNIADGDPLGNWYRVNQFDAARDLKKIGKPVDRLEWEMTPPTVNAYYDPTQNNINFPAGILQSPFYSNAADDTVNYGGIGAVIGHELTHGFDDEGRQFDANGNLRDWWSKQDGEEFEKRADCIVEQYGKYSPVSGVNLNGKLTLGENAADNGGLRLAYMALINSLTARSQQDTKMDGFTPSQRFFLGWGQIWCQNRTEASERMRAQTDPHSPGKYRVNGVVSNMPEFSKAFGCRAGQPMVPEGGGCRVW